MLCYVRREHCQGRENKRYEAGKVSKQFKVMYSQAGHGFGRSCEETADSAGPHGIPDSSAHWVVHERERESKRGFCLLLFCKSTVSQ